MNQHSAHERRQYDRHSVRGGARIEPLHESASFGGFKDVNLLDIGRTGVRFMTNQTLPAGSQWRLRLIHHDHVLAMMPILVRYCEPQADASFHIGAQFMIEPAVLGQLGIKEQDLGDEELEGRFLDPNASTIEAADA